MVSSRSRTRSPARYRRFKTKKCDRRSSPARCSVDERSRSRSRSRTASPSSRSRSVSSSPDDLLRGRDEQADTPRYWRHRGRSPITLRELTALVDYDKRTGSRILIAGLNSIVTEKDLKKKFAMFGSIKDVCLLKEGKSGEPRGLALLTLDPDRNVDAAVQALDQTLWNGRILLVEKL